MLAKMIVTVSGILLVVLVNRYFLFSKKKTVRKNAKEN
jgi:hypothetical protein